MNQLIPVTVLTGFLGAGKSTLLRRVLTEKHDRKIAVIENEFGEEDIDSEIIVSGRDEEIIQLSNGCLCCGIRDDLRATLQDLAQRRNDGQISFDQVMIETTGLADPGPIAQTFFLDDTVVANYRPDAILTLVDAKHGMMQLNTRREARRQVGFADRIFLTKTDLVESQEVLELSERLWRINSHAPQNLVSFGEIDMAEVFDVGGFNLSPELDLEPKSQCVGHAHNGDTYHHAHHDDVNSFVFRSDRPLYHVRFSQFMNSLVKAYGPALMRYKGVLNVLGEDRKVIFQGVHQLMSHHVGDHWGSDNTPRQSRLVFIGTNLPQSLMMNSLKQCLVCE